MKITVTTIDGVSGQLADGVEITITGRLAGEQTSYSRGLTDAAGNFTYAPAADRLRPGETYTVALDVDQYYASLGIVASYQRVTILMRIIDPQADYQIGTLITPVTHTTWGHR